MVKKAKSQSQKTSQWAQPIHQLEGCIREDYVRLEKAYPKAISAAEKEVARLTKVLQKAKTVKSAVKSKRSKQVPLNPLLDKNLAQLKEEVAVLKAGFKKFKAKKKLWQQFEKHWVKKLKTARKTKKPTRKPRAKQQLVTAGESSENRAKFGM